MDDAIVGRIAFDVRFSMGLHPNRRVQHTKGQRMGLDAGISIWLPDETEVDVQELREEAKAWLFGRFGGTNGMYCVPFAYRDEEDGSLTVSVQVIGWGRNLEAAGYEVGDILRVLAAWAFNSFDPAEGLRVDAWSG